MSLAKKVARNVRIGRGTCPNGHTLMCPDKPMDGEPSIGVRVKCGGKSGNLYLNAFFGRFEYECDFELKKDDVVQLFCPKCGVDLAIDANCNLCNIAMFAIQLPDGGQVEACPTVGCQKHSLKIMDLGAQLDRMYVDETKVQM